MRNRARDQIGRGPQGEDESAGRPGCQGEAEPFDDYAERTGAVEAAEERAAGKAR